ncbi:hypothetical protein D3C87_1235250 [compost metagenome]
MRFGHDVDQLNSLAVDVDHSRVHGAPHQHVIVGRLDGCSGWHLLNDRRRRWRQINRCLFVVRDLIPLGDAQQPGNVRFVRDFTDMAALGVWLEFVGGIAQHNLSWRVALDDALNLHAMVLQRVQKKGQP